MNSFTLPAGTSRFAMRCALMAGMLAALAASEIVRGAPKTSAEFRRKQAEMKRNFELRQRQNKAEHERRTKEIQQNASKRSTSSKTGSSAPFYASGAPAPEE